MAAIRRKLTVRSESWPIAGRFTISRGSKTAADVVTITLEQDGAVGHGECVPYTRYGETIEGVIEALEQARKSIEDGAGRQDIAGLVQPKAGCNALDCALWDLEAKLSGTPAWRLAGLKTMAPLTTAYTLSLDSVDEMARSAKTASGRPLLKLKLGGADGSDPDRLRAVRQAAPDSRIIIDANEGWSPAQLPELFAVCQQTGVELIEQPLPANDDETLRNTARPVPVCADESAHDRATLPELIGKYDAINIKLDKTGGLTEALALADAASTAGLEIMVGCMLATSLAMAPAMIVAQSARVVDLDGPLLLAKDRDAGIHFEGSIMHPPPPALWG